MNKLLETKLQKIILLIGGILIFIRLSNVNYYQTYTAILQSFGIGILTLVLLTVLKDFKTTLHLKLWNVLKRYWLWLVIIIVIVLVIVIRNEYLKRLSDEKFHDSEVAYQNCLDKIARTSIWINATEKFLSESINYKKEENNFYQEWINTGKSGYDMNKGYWEIYFMKWMMENHKDFCQQDTDKINSFINWKLNNINQTPKK